jgi:hypothetical protein
MSLSLDSRISSINNIISTYGQVTIRQIYYRLLGVEPNINYRKVQYACKIGRADGRISHSGIVDRSRPVYGLDLYDSVDSYLNDIPLGFYLDYWHDSNIRPQIWTEKDALSQILYSVSKLYHVDVFVTRGFLSISNKTRWGGSDVAILYFGDFDPSGLFIDEDLSLEVVFDNFDRIALTEDMCKDLPSVPVNKNDPRASSYISLYGDRGWELDALDPAKLKSLVDSAIKKYIDFDVEQKKEFEELISDKLESAVDDIRSSFDSSSEEDL